MKAALPYRSSISVSSLTAGHPESLLGRRAQPAPATTFQCDGQFPDNENPLRVTRFWDGYNESHDQFRGDEIRPNTRLLGEAATTARLAHALGPQSDSWAHLVELATGNLDWIFGRNTGVRGRYSTDWSTLEFASASSVANLGSASLAQAVWGIHYWDQPTVVRGVDGNELEEGADRSPEMSPWGHFPGDAAESFIFRDGQLLIASEILSRTLHPSLVLEAEEWSGANFTPKCGRPC